MTESTPVTVFAHILLFNSVATHGAESIHAAIRSLQAQVGFTSGDTLQIVVTDNGSSDAGIQPFATDAAYQNVRFRSREHNIGFAGAQNEVASEFLASNCKYFLLVNPDCALDPAALGRLVAALETDDSAGIACPKLRKPGATQLDSVGMHITPDLRHFDTGNGEIDRGQFDQDAYVFGASGACMLMRRNCLQTLCLPPLPRAADRFLIFPALELGATERVDLFDEGFFAYREDADLAWRAQLFGWRCRYVAHATATHTRVVQAGNREAVAPTLNLHGVRNRFLLQFNNYAPFKVPSAIVPGLVIRNLLVVFGVLLREQSSLPAFVQSFRLLPRALARRNYVYSRVSDTDRSAQRRWFCRQPFREELPTTSAVDSEPAYA